MGGDPLFALPQLVDLHNSAPAVVDSFTAIKLSCSDEDSATVISTRFGSLVYNFKCTVVLILHQCQLTNVRTPCHSLPLSVLMLVCV